MESFLAAQLLTFVILKGVFFVCPLWLVFELGISFSLKVQRVW